MNVHRDLICWVFGERNARPLSGRMLDEVITAIGGFHVTYDRRASKLAASKLGCSLDRRSVLYAVDRIDLLARSRAISWNRAFDEIERITESAPCNLRDVLFGSAQRAFLAAFPESLHKPVIYGVDGNSYVTLVFILVAAALLGFGIYFSEHGLSETPLLMAMFFVTWESVARHTQTAMMHFGDAPPQFFAAYEHQQVSTPQVAVCVSTMLDDRSRFLALLLNTWQNAKFVESSPFFILCDYPDASHPHVTDSERELTSWCMAEVERLNARLSPRAAPVRMLIRRRTYSRTQGCWIGRDRKRGKVIDLMNFLQSGERTDFDESGAALSSAEPTTYLLSLDEDSLLTAETLSNLLRCACVESNKAELDGGRVSRGHGIYVPAPFSREEDRMYWRFRGRIAGAPYEPSRAGVRDFSTELFDECAFTGKGLLDIKAFLASHASKPTNERVLSHDTFEAMFLRPMFVMNAALLGSAPRTQTSLKMRTHRWTRGDVQNAVYLLARSRQWKRSSASASIAQVFHVTRLLRSSLSKVSLGILVLVAALSPKPALLAITFSLFLVIPGAEIIAGLFLRRLRHEGYWNAVIYFVIISSASVTNAMLTLDAVLHGVFSSLTGRGCLNWTPTSEADHKKEPLRMRIYSACVLSFSLLGALAATIHAAWYNAAILLLLAVSPLLAKLL
jgi:hypothetical protein